MKPELKAKFLQHLNQKKQDAGFTLIELLVVIIIIGILAAVALPSFLSQAAKGRAAEAKSNIGAMNRAQQAYFLEQQKFTTVINDLGLSTPTQTDNFTYTATASGAINTGVNNLGSSRQPDIKSYAGGVFYDSTVNNTTSILCEANVAGATTPTGPTASTSCATNTKQVK